MLLHEIKAFFRAALLSTLVLACTSCQLTTCKLEPTICYTPSTSRITDLPSAFPPLSPEERDQEWGRELVIGDAFAREWDLYRAITSYKRTLFLLPANAMERRLQVEYDIILCYYLGHKYEEAINLFENSPLAHVNHLFPAYNQVLLMAYECYLEMDQIEKANCILELINKMSPETGEDLSIYENLVEGNLEAAQCQIDQHRDFCTIQPDLDTYYRYAKSPSLARKLNAILPGAGYYYIEQKKSAVTAFLINTLFTIAAYQFFRHGYPAAGIVTASLEAGWYIGGINGVGIEAQEFNNRLYEGVSKKILSDHFMFPILMFETSF